MAIINCSECKKEISDSAKVCPHCGYKLPKKKEKLSTGVLVGIIIAMGVIAIIMIVCIEGYNSKVTKIKDVNTAITELEKKGIPSQQDYDFIMKKYNALSVDEKKQIKNTKTLEKYRDVDLKKIKELSDKIGQLENNSPFAEVIDIEDEYNKMSSEEKNLIDISSIESHKKLSNVEKAALAVAKNVHSVMQSKNDFKVTAISVKDDLKKMNFYWVQIKYSGTNGFGANIDKISFFPMGDDYKDPFFGLASITGMDDYLDNTSTYNEYIKCK